MGEPSELVASLERLQWTHETHAASQNLLSDIICQKKRLRENSCELLIWTCHVTGSVKLATQTCRVQHRAGGLFLLVSVLAENLKALQVLSQDSYVKGWQLADDVKILTNIPGFERNTIRVRTGPLPSVFWGQDVCEIHGLLFRALNAASKVEWTISTDVNESNLENLQKKRDRADNEAKALGGLRSAWKSVATRPPAIIAGAKLWNVIQNEIKDDHLDLLDTVGTDKYDTVRLGMLAQSTRRSLCVAYGVEQRPDGKIHAEPFQKLVEAQLDPDTEAVRWLVEGAAPLGIEKEILAKGAFRLLKLVQREPKTISDQPGRCRATVAVIRKFKMKQRRVCAKICVWAASSGRRRRSTSRPSMDL